MIVTARTITFALMQIGRCLKDIGINFPGKWGAFASSGGMGAWINAAEPLLNGPGVRLLLLCYAANNMADAIGGYECDGLDGEFVNNYIASA